jgi:hypothetical protein
MPVSLGNPRAQDSERDRPLRLLPPVLVPLSPEQERRAVDALAGLLAGFLERQEPASGPNDYGDAGVQSRPDDPEAA